MTGNCATSYTVVLHPTDDYRMRRMTCPECGADVAVLRSGLMAGHGSRRFSDAERLDIKIANAKARLAHLERQREALADDKESP